MNFDDSCDYGDEEDPGQCRNCRQYVEGKPETVSCQFCDAVIKTGSEFYRCEHCNNDWKIGPRQVSKDKAVCATCRQIVVGNCAVCQQPTSGSEARSFDCDIVCCGCLNTPETIWCPVCQRTFSYRGYLKGVFRHDRPGLHAASLVTHYRHEHRKSYDRACGNPRYAATIPNYDYNDHKAEINNQAKRQIIRAIAKHVRNGSYPPSAPIEALELVRAFGCLQQNDDKTEKLIAQTLEKLG